MIFVNYHCAMAKNESVTTFEQVFLENKSSYFYTIKPYELTNVLGENITVLQEYTFTKKEDTSDLPVTKLYRTKEGNWYDHEGAKMNAEKVVVRMLKSAIDKNEKKANKNK